MSDSGQKKDRIPLGWAVTLGVIVTVVGFLQSAGADPSIIWQYVLFAGLGILAFSLLTGIARLISNLTKSDRRGQ